MISTPSDVPMFSRLPEADQRAILRQVNDSEFERYITHAHTKLRSPMREEHAGKRTEAPAAAPSPRPPQEQRRHRYRRPLSRRRHRPRLRDRRHLRRHRQEGGRGQTNCLAPVRWLEDERRSDTWLVPCRSSSLPRRRRRAPARESVQTIGFCFLV
jgi:hypothetical protein